MALVASGTFLLVFAVSGLLSAQPHASGRIVKARSLEAQYYGETAEAVMAVSDPGKDMSQTMSLLMMPQPLWGPVWHIDGMLNELQQANPSEKLVAKMKMRLEKGAEFSTKSRSGKAAVPHVSPANITTGKAPPDKMIVVARADEDVSFLSLYLSDIPHTVYQAGWTPDRLLSWVGPMPAFKAAPQAKETNVYLQYIVSHYDKLPETIVFIHAHRHSWHMHDVVKILKRLRWGEVGYANLRHKGYQDWDCGAAWEAMFPCGWEGSILTPREPFNTVFAAQPNAGTAAQVSMDLKQHWGEFFEEELGPLPELVYTQCCAEFVVHRDRILAHPKEFYSRALEIINDYHAMHYHELALAFEYAWHMIFGEPPVMAPIAECKLLNCTTSGTTQPAVD